MKIYIYPELAVTNQMGYLGHCGVALSHLVSSDQTAKITADQTELFQLQTCPVSNVNLAKYGTMTFREMLYKHLQGNVYTETVVREH